MKQKLTLQNTYISFTASSRKRSIKISFLGSKDGNYQLPDFTPSFLGNGWETSLLPKTKRGLSNESFLLTFDWIRKFFMKMQKSGQEERRKSWTTAIAKLFL